MKQYKLGETFGAKALQDCNHFGSMRTDEDGCRYCTLCKEIFVFGKVKKKR